MNNNNYNEDGAENINNEIPKTDDSVSGHIDNEDDFVTAGDNSSNSHEENIIDSDEYLAVPTFSRRAARNAKKKKSKDENGKKRPSNKSDKKFTESKFFKVLILVLGIILAIILLIYAFCIMTLPSDTVSRNVYVENLNVSGLTYDGALKSIEKTYLLENQEITLSCGEQTYSIMGIDVDLTASPEETAKKAFEFGKSGNKLKDGFTALTLLFHKRVIIPPAGFDEEKMREKINEFGIAALGERRNHYVEILDGKTVVWPGATGYDGNSDAALAEIAEAVKNENFSDISVTLSSAPPEDLTVDDFDGAVYADPVNAHFELENNEVKVIEEQNGRYINKEEAASLLPNVKEGGNPIEIPYYYSYPSIAAADIKSKLFADSMATYSTSYASSTSNRASNVARAASLINGKILMPGEVFSFNDTVGKRSVENGFSTAPEYVDGKTVDGIGGGTCQVSSTLYNAVLYADLEIVTRTNHMFTVAYVPNGQDATVADSGPDFKFKNNTEYPIKISAYTGGGEITVSIIGTNWNPKREVKISNSTTLSSDGSTHVKTTRTVYTEGKVIRSESMPSSTYKKHVEEETAAASSSAVSSNSSSSSSSSSSRAASSAAAETASGAAASEQSSDVSQSGSSNTAPDGSGSSPDEDDNSNAENIESEE